MFLIGYYRGRPIYWCSFRNKFYTVVKTGTGKIIDNNVPTCSLYKLMKKKEFTRVPIFYFALDFDFAQRHSVNSDNHNSCFLLLNSKNKSIFFELYDKVGDLKFELFKSMSRKDFLEKYYIISIHQALDEYEDQKIIPYKFRL